MQGQEHHRQEDRRCVTVKQLYQLAISRCWRLDQLAPSHLRPPDDPRCSCFEVDTRRRQSSLLTGDFPKIGQKSNGGGRFGAR